MAVLGKRKAPEPVVSQEDANEIFRRHFESRFEPIETSAKKSRKDEDDEDEQSGDEGDEEEEEEQEEEEEEEEGEGEEEWGGLSDDEISDDDVQTIEVVDHSNSQAPKAESMSKRELKAFMSSRPPDQTAKPRNGTESPTTTSSKALPEDAPSLLAQDLELRRLLAESHLLSGKRSMSVNAGAAAEPKAFAAGRTRQKATDMRIQALGSGVSIHAQEKMPMKMRKGMVAAADAREAKRRREARENGVILERETGKKKRRDRGSGADVHRPGVGRLKGAELRISERDVKGIEGGRDAFGRRGKR